MKFKPLLQYLRNAWSFYFGLPCVLLMWHRLWSEPRDYDFLIFVFLALACLPWLPFSKRFSLRTLLIVTTLIAVVLGIIVWAVRN